jgi:hypothetical protein
MFHVGGLTFEVEHIIIQTMKQVNPCNCECFMLEVQRLKLSISLFNNETSKPLQLRMFHVGGLTFEVEHIIIQQ